MKDALVVGAICLLAVLAGALFYFKGDSLIHIKKEGVVSHTVLAKGTNALGVTTRTNYRIQDQEQFSALWALIYGNNQPNIPSVDFGEQEVIAVFDGSHSTGGYRIMVRSITDTGLNRVVSIEHVAPSTECAVASAQTSPFELVVVPRMADSLTITREETTTLLPCS